MNKLQFNSIEKAGIYLKQQLERDLNAILHTHDQVVLILPGGNSIKLFFPYLILLNVAWEKIIIGLSDERCVPLDHEKSNEKQLRENFLNFLPFYNFCKLNEELATKIKRHPTLTVLSMGGDGHVASLFPDDYRLLNSSNCIVVTQRADCKRISLSLPVLLRTKQRYIIVCGQKKSDFLDAINFKKSPLEALFKVSSIIKIT